MLTNTKDPRFLVFEFTWNILLRESQVALVREFMDALKNNRSLVKQMIMGAGKTTTVGPLLALMLGDGKSLVVQVKFLCCLLCTHSNFLPRWSLLLYWNFLAVLCDLRSPLLCTSAFSRSQATELRRWTRACTRN